MGKGSFMIQDSVRRKSSHITDLLIPNTFMVRGRLPFPQGLLAIGVLFAGKLPADVYAHPYFVEKQSNPAQPSPQLHVTEELQSVMKVMSGLRYMNDDLAKLDNTMTVVTDYLVPVRGRMVTCSGIENARKKAKQIARWRLMSRMYEGMPDFIVDATTPKTGAAMAPGAGGGGVGGGMSRSSGAAGTSLTPEGSTLFGRTLFPTPEQCSTGTEYIHRFFRLTLEGPEAVAAGEVGSSFSMSSTAQPYSSTVKPPTFAERQGGYTVLYNPIETNEKTFAHLINRLHEEDRVVRAIVVPTRHSWRQVQLWADAFPDAEIFSSCAIPFSTIEDDNKASSTTAEDRGACITMVDGTTGLSFPEVDLEAEEAAEARRKEAMASSTSSSQAWDVITRGPGASRGVGVIPSSQQQHLQPQPQQPSTTCEDSEEPEDPADVLWRPEVLSTAFADAPTAFVGLRGSDAGRVRVLTKEANPDVIELTPRVRLYRVPGDAVAEEYVLYDEHSKSLSCTDLFHGGYSDLDPHNTWMCRVWFKLMKKGDYKRTDLVPRFKWLQVLRQGTLDQVQQFVASLTSSLDIRFLVFAHGTPPEGESPASTLRRQWNVPLENEKTAAPNDKVRG